MIDWPIDDRFSEYYTREPAKNTKLFEDITGSTRVQVQENITTEHLRNNYREYAKSAHLGLVLHHLKSKKMCYN